MVLTMKKKLNSILNKCKSLSRQLTRSSSYSSSRSKSSREKLWGDHMTEKEQEQTVFVGSTRRQYAISSKQLNRPLLSALMEEKSKHNPGGYMSVKCEVVLFDHLLWMLDNAEPQLTSDSLQELAELYAL